MNGSARILVVDDEPQILRALRVGLSARGYTVEVAATGELALDAAAARPPDVVVLDLMLPGIDGLEVCRRLREWTRVPIIVLSAKGEEREKVAALDLGADDYLTKPFGMDELLARIRVALRRASRGQDAAPLVQAGDLEIDLARRAVSRGGRAIHLTPSEYELLRYLAAHADRVVTHRQLLREALGPSYEDATQNLRYFVAQLRKKIEPVPAEPRYLVTEPGVGYRLRTSPPDRP
jgi:two-component system KDP operon response regulator KdpE